MPDDELISTTLTVNMHGTVDNTALFMVSMQELANELGVIIESVGGDFPKLPERD